MLRNGRIREVLGRFGIVIRADKQTEMHDIRFLRWRIARLPYRPPLFMSFAVSDP